MRNLYLLLPLFFILGPSAFANPKPIAQTETVTKKTPGHAAKITAKIGDAKKLWLVIDDDGALSCDHANWAEPHLTGPKGTLKLTDLKWKAATVGWGQPRINKSPAGSPMRINGKDIPYGIGAHAPSVLVFDIPEGYDTFHATGGLDNSGTDQKNCGDQASVIFKVYDAKPPSGPSLPELAEEGTTYISPDAFDLPNDLEIQVWATSPLLRNPTNIDIDRHGRVWVAEGLNYRRLRAAPEGDRIAVLTDTDGDGKADKSHTFVQEKALVAPLGVAVIGNQVIVAQPPDLIVYTDVDENAVFDPEIDKREVLLTGFAGRNHDHSLHSVTAGPNGQWYFNWGNCGADVTDKDGFNIKAGSPYSMKQIAGHTSSDGHVYLGGVAARVNPDGTGLRPIGHNFRNSYEQVITSFGDVFQNDNDDPPASRTTWLMEYGNLGFASNDGQRSWRADQRWGQDTPTAEWRQDDPGSLPAGDVYGGGSPTGIAYIEGDGLGEPYRGLLLSCEPARNVVFGYYPKPSAAGFTLERFDFLTSNVDKNFAGADFRRGAMGTLQTLFRPSDVCVGPDGAIYVADWFDQRVGGHQALDKTYSGTIYRIVKKGSKPTAPSFEESTIEGAITALKNDSPNVRNIGFVALKNHGALAIPALTNLLEDDNPYLRARAVWLLAQLGSDGLAIVEDLLKHEDPQHVIVAFRALRHVGHRLFEHAAALAGHTDAGVRREVALALRDHPFDHIKDIFKTLASGYDGTDRHYLEALGYGAAGQEQRLYEFLMADLKVSDWDEAHANIAWRLHPPSAIQDIADFATSDRPIEKRKTMLVALGVMDHPKAAYAMATIAKEQAKNDSEIAAEAKRWVDLNHKGMWRKHDALGVMNGKPTPKPSYTDHIVPTVLGAQVELPDPTDILKLTGDAERGKITLSRCIMCHKHSGRGIEFGPDLTTWGRTQPPEVIIKSIVDPNADIAHGFEGVEIKTKSGNTIQGFLAASGDPVIVRVFGGQQITIDAADITSQQKVKQSWMVSAANMGLTAQDVADITAYLRK